MAQAQGQVVDWTYPAGDFADVVRSPNCPPVSPDGQGECTKSTCRVCPLKFPKCPKEFLTNCTEVTANLYKLQDILNGTQRPLESYMKRADRYTLWTPCGLLKTANRVSEQQRIELRPPDRDGGWDSIRCAACLAFWRALGPFGSDVQYLPWWCMYERARARSLVGLSIETGKWD